MLACVACFGWTTGKYKVFAPLILTEFLSKLLNWRAKKHSFLSKYRFTIFMNKIICSFSTLYLANRGIDVIIIGLAQQRKTQVFASVQNSHRTSQLAAEKHSFLSKRWFTISHEHSNLFHLNFIYKLQTYASILYVGII